MYTIYRTIDHALAKRSLLHHPVGHGWTAKAVGVEQSCATVENATPEQAELLATINGKKVFWRNIPSNTHLCYALPAARKALVKVLHYLKGLSVLNCCDYFIGIGCRTNANLTKQLEPS